MKCTVSPPTPSSMFSSTKKIRHHLRTLLIPSQRLIQHLHGLRRISHHLLLIRYDNRRVCFRWKRQDWERAYTGVTQHIRNQDKSLLEGGNVSYVRQVSSLFGLINAIEKRDVPSV